MDRENITALIASNIQLSTQGQEVEHAKLDFKKEWYNLKEDKGIASFLKDVTAIANTVGPDGYLVIGFDTKTNQYNQVSFSDSGLRDSAELPGIIVKHIDRAFLIDYFPIEIQGNILNVIHIPPSLDKPHVIRNHKTWPSGNLREEAQRIFVRKGSTIREATKYDLDFMYYDRKNIRPEYQLYGTIHINNLNFPIQFDHISDNNNLVTNLGMRIGVTLENTGTRMLSHAQMDATITTMFFPEFPESLTFSGHEKFNHRLLLKPMDLVDATFELNCASLNQLSYQKVKDATEIWKANKTKLSILLTFNTTNRIRIPIIL